MEESGFNFDNGNLTICDKDIEGIPQDVAENYGKLTKVLDLSYNKISRVQYMEYFQNLEHLILDNNLIIELHPLPVLKKITTCSLNNNQIADIDPLLNNLKDHLPSLTHLSLLKNPCCPNYLTGRDSEDYKRYRYYVLHKLPKLLFLDMTPVSAFEKKEAARIGAYQKVARPKIEPKKEPAKSQEVPPEEDVAKDQKVDNSAVKSVKKDTTPKFGQSKYVIQDIWRGEYPSIAKTCFFRYISGDIAKETGLYETMTCEEEVNSLRKISWWYNKSDWTKFFLIRQNWSKMLTTYEETLGEDGTTGAASLNVEDIENIDLGSTFLTGGDGDYASDDVTQGNMSQSRGSMDDFERLDREVRRRKARIKDLEKTLTQLDKNFVEIEKRREMMQSFIVEHQNKEARIKKRMKDEQAKIEALVKQKHKFEGNLHRTQKVADDLDEKQRKLSEAVRIMDEIAESESKDTSTLMMRVQLIKDSNWKDSIIATRGKISTLSQDLASDTKDLQNSLSEKILEIEKRRRVLDASIKENAEKRDSLDRAKQLCEKKETTIRFINNTLDNLKKYTRYFSGSNDSRTENSEADVPNSPKSSQAHKSARSQISVTESKLKDAHECFIILEFILNSIKA